MEFSSVLFVEIFLPVVLVGYYLLGLIRKESAKTLAQNLWLACASLVFFAWGGLWQLGAFVALLAVNFAAGLWMGNRPEAAEGETKPSAGRRAVFIVFLVVDVLVLVAFKAFSSLLYMIGISFIVFQLISYLADVYMGRTKVCRNPLHFFLYMALFAQLTQGPIVRYGEMGPQFLSRKTTLSGFMAGLKRFCYGLAKKVLIANIVAKAVDEIWGVADLSTLGTGVAWLGLLLYTLQIYYDFSGYTDMAIGIGGMLGFSLPENFNYPYTSLSVQEFWRRWHITLSSWFRDYIYIPLGGSRCAKPRICFNLFVVFLVTGIWHGTDLTFILWGLLYALFSILERLFLGDLLKKNPVKPLNWLYATFVVMMGWVLFRAPDMSAAVTYFGQLFSFVPSSAGLTILNYLNMEVLVAAVLGILLAGFLQRPLAKLYSRVQNNLAVMTVDTLIQLVLFVWALLLIVGGSYNPSIYAQF